MTDVTGTDVRNSIEVLRAAGYLVMDPDGQVMARWEDIDADPPMPAAVGLHATVRDLGSQEQVVARVHMQDVVGEVRTVDLSPEVAMALLVQLAQFIRQTGVEGL